MEHWFIFEIIITFGAKLYMQSVGISMGANCTTPYRSFSTLLWERRHGVPYKWKQTGMIDTFKPTFRHLDDFLNIVNIYFEQMFLRIHVYPEKLQS